MPLVIINREERLTYRPDGAGQSFRLLPPDLLAALRTLVDAAQAQQVSVPPEIVAALSDVETLGERDAVFYYRRLPGNERARILYKHTVNGVLDFWSARWELGCAALLDWENVLDADGHPIPFDRAVVPYLPGTILNDIGVLVDSQMPDDFTKNFVGSSNGSRPLVG